MCVHVGNLVPEKMREKRKEKLVGGKGERGREGGGERNCGGNGDVMCSSSRRTMWLTFICTRQVGAAILATLSHVVFTLTRQSKSSNLGKKTGRELKVIMHIC